MSPHPHAESAEPIQSSGRDRLGALAALLVTLIAVPLIVLVIPNTVSSVILPALRELGLGSAHAPGLVRADGLAVPALLFAVPPGAVAARRLPAWLVLLAGLLVVLGAELAAQPARTVALIGALRVGQGLGAGLALPATLVLVWRYRAVRALWAGVLAAGLLLATPVMLAGVPAAGADWRAVLQPALPLVGAALAAAALCGLLRGRRWRAGLSAFRAAERTQLLLPLVPASGFAVLAVVTTYGWSESTQLIVAGVGLAALLGLALVGAGDSATGSPLGFAVVVVSTGALGLPVAAPLAGLLSTGQGPQHTPLAPFAAGAAAAVCGALLSSAALSIVERKAAAGPQAGSQTGPQTVTGTRQVTGMSLVLGGHGLMITSMMVFLATGPQSSPWLLALPLAALGAGMGTALAAALRTAGLGAALFGLALLLPALLTGQLVVGALQVATVNTAVQAGGGALNVVYALTAAFRVWLIVAGVVAVLMAGAVALAARRHTLGTVRQSARADTEQADTQEPIGADGAVSAVRAG